MGINFNYGNFTSSYGIQQIPVVKPQDIAVESTAPQVANEPAQSTGYQAEKAAEEITRASRIANLEDVSLTFNREDTFDSIGVDADIASLDMTKAISDMRRDSILADYQTFVGPSAEQLIANLEDGIVIQK